MPRAVEHVVLFKPRPEATREQLQTVCERLAALRDQIPGILGASSGLNFSERSGGYEVGLVVRFESREALEAYLPHPAHRAVVETFVRPATDGVIVVDYEL